MNDVDSPHYYLIVQSLTSRVEQAVERRSLLQPGDRVLVAVSGGMDSMVLLRVMHTLAESKSWRLIVAHFDHQLRDRASRADARFVGRAARTLGLEFTAASGDVRGYARATRTSVEMAARVLRHRFLAKAAGAAKVAAVALAHHADDQVELFFLRIFRGAGVEGLAGMDWQSPSPENRAVRLIRPMLEERREAIARFAAEQRVRFREDSTNRSTMIGRNRIRHALLPLLRRDYQGALDGIILRTMAALRDTAGFLAQEAERWRRQRRKVPYAKLGPALQRQILIHQLRELKVVVDFDLVERLRLSQGRRVSFGVGEFLSRDNNGIIQRTAGMDVPQEALPLKLDGKEGDCRFGDLRLAWRIASLRAGAAAPRKQRQGMEIFDADKVGPTVILRYWRPGDRFQPIGLSRPAKLQDLFINLRIPRSDRHRLAIATTAAGTLFWVEGLRIAEGFKLDKSSKRGLKLAWRRSSFAGKGRVAPRPSPC